MKYGEAPAGIKEVFELCRGFERAYVSFVNVSCRGVQQGMPPVPVKDLPPPFTPTPRASPQLCAKLGCAGLLFHAVEQH